MKCSFVMEFPRTNDVIRIKSSCSYVILPWLSCIWRQLERSMKLLQECYSIREFTVRSALLNGHDKLMRMFEIYLMRSKLTCSNILFKVLHQFINFYHLTHRSHFLIKLKTSFIFSCSYFCYANFTRPVNLMQQETSHWYSWKTMKK